MITQEQKNWIKSVKLTELKAEALKEHEKIKSFKQQSLVIGCAAIGNARGYCYIPQTILITLQERLLCEVAPALERCEQLKTELNQILEM